ncbi:MAG: hypothetical protein E7668_05045 [Ruminococcaceae bacterium]|nr:hypothetical protein [Oscillospiraceae bacterium]
MRHRSSRRGGGFRPELLKRSLIYGLLLLLLTAAQCSFFTGLSFLPATPDLLLGALMALTLLENRPTVAILAIAGGFLCDALGSTGVSFTPLFYLLTVVLAGILAEKMLPRFWSFLLLMLPAALLRMGYSALRAALGGISPLSILKSSLLPELLLTVLCALPLYALCLLCAHLAKERRQDGIR